ncbi:DUF2794 domain-containing protein [Lacibacterium aquatile]|uniref:DUF2794 domain-containing protein n=1 Tax=Lacibacterium aquatile TaxID=1168082 RepID=A0ABW5DQB8_9PROT
MSLISLSDYRRSAKQVAFDRRELMSILNLYSQRVARGEWRDYAIDSLPGMAVFSIFKSSFEKPLFSIVKQPGGKRGDYLLFSGREKLAQGRTLDDVFTRIEKQLVLVR